MTYTSSVGAPNYNYSPMQTQSAYQATAVAPTNSAYQQQDVYRPQQPQQSYAAGQQNAEPYAVVNKTDFMLGAAGAIGGFFLAGMVGLSGPIGALILGVALLGLSAGVRAIKHNSQQKQQQQVQQAVHPGFQQQQYQYPGQNTNQSYQPSSYTPSQQSNYQAQYPQAAAPQQNMQYAQNYQNYAGQQGVPQTGMPTSASGQTWGDSAWEKFLSWL